MFNLLPKAEKKAIRREYRARLAVVMLVCAFAACSVAALLLFPSYFLSAEKEAIAAERFEILKRSVAAGEAARLDAELQDARAALAFLRPAAPKRLMRETIERVVKAKNARISIEGFTVVFDGEGREMLSLTGTARDRGSLVAFADSLRGLRFFKEVELPLGSLAKDADVAFSLTLREQEP